MIERQEFIDKVSTGHTDCMIQLESGGTQNQFINCELEYLKSAKEGCAKYQGVPGCDKIESIIDENDLRDVFP